MDSEIVIRDETAADIQTISDVIRAAFETLEVSDHTEQFVVKALRAAGALRVSLVAEVEGQVVGHIAFSPVIMTDGTKGWYGLGPVSVTPDFQRQGIGQALIRDGLARLRHLHAGGCCLVGHPRYYRQFGFENVSGLVYEGVPGEFLFVLPFGDHIPSGQVIFHDAFKAQS